MTQKLINKQLHNLCVVTGTVLRRQHEICPVEFSFLYSFKDHTVRCWENVGTQWGNRLIPATNFLDYIFQMHRVGSLEAFQLLPIMNEVFHGAAISSYTNYDSVA